MTGPVDPVEDVEPPVGAQREEVVACDGLRLSGLAHHEQLEIISIVSVSVADPNPDSDPPDPHVFGNPGSGSISQSRAMDPDIDPSIIKQNSNRNFTTVLFCDFFLTFYLSKMM
jgi:hypothetical protein